MKRQLPIIGNDYPAGRISAILMPQGKNRGTRVEVQCAHCPDHFTCRFTELRNGERKSCRCLMVKSFKANQRAMVQRLDPALRMKLFERRELTGDSKKAAADCGVHPHTASFAWQEECRRLGNLPQEELRRVYEISQARSVEQVMLKHPYSKAQVIRICRIWQKRVKAGTEALKAILLQLQEFAPIKSLTGDVFHDAKLYIDEAIERAQRKPFAMGRYPGELRQRELALTLKKRSDFGWVFEVLNVMPTELILPCFGKAGTRFLDICRNTFARRKQRQKDGYLASLEESAKPAKKAQKRIPDEPFLPQPSQSPEALAKLFTDYARLQNAA
jgi:hypothetical protein